MIDTLAPNELANLTHLRPRRLAKAYWDELIVLGSTGIHPSGRAFADDLTLHAERQPDRPYPLDPRSVMIVMGLLKAALARRDISAEAELLLEALWRVVRESPGAAGSRAIIMNAQTFDDLICVEWTDGADDDGVHVEVLMSQSLEPMDAWRPVATIDLPRRRFVVALNEIALVRPGDRVSEFPLSTIDLMLGQPIQRLRHLEWGELLPVTALGGGETLDRIVHANAVSDPESMLRMVDDWYAREIPF